MKEDELIKLKTDLLNILKNQKYTQFNPFTGGRLADSKSIDTIAANINTPVTTQKFEELTEKYAKELIYTGVDFDSIELTLQSDVFVSEYFIRKYLNNKSLREKIDLKQEDLLKDITSITIKLLAKKDGKIVNVKTSPITLGTVNYNQFVNAIESLGYTITPKSYDELVQKLINGKKEDLKSIVKIDFAPQHKHKR